MHQTCIRLCKCDASSAKLNPVHRFTEQLLVVSYIYSYPTINEDGSCFPQPQDGRLHFLLHPHHAKRGGKKKKKKIKDGIKWYRL